MDKPSLRSFREVVVNLLVRGKIHGKGHHQVFRGGGCHPVNAGWEASIDKAIIGFLGHVVFNMSMRRSIYGQGYGQVCWGCSC